MNITQNKQKSLKTQQFKNFNVQNLGRKLVVVLINEHAVKLPSKYYVYIQRLVLLSALVRETSQ